MAKLPPACKQLLYLLISKYRFFKKKGLLSSEGFFYYTDEKLAKEMDLSPKTIKRHRRRLHADRYIVMLPGKYEGLATQYFVSIEQDKMSPSGEVKSETNYPLEGVKFSSRAGQNVPPVKEIIKEKVKDDIYPCGNLKEEVTTFKNLGWKDQTIKDHLIITRGFSESAVDAAMGKHF